MKEVGETMLVFSVCEERDEQCEKRPILISYISNQLLSLILGLAT